MAGVLIKRENLDIEPHPQRDCDEKVKAMLSQATEPQEAAEISETDLPLVLSEAAWPPGTLTLNFWPSELPDNKFLLF